ncbi:MAG: glycosyltransferase family 2 protein [Planctomycetota bacterium]|jgi:GT2 family glycosyltransferase
MTLPEATVVITTRQRKTDLRKALESCLLQDLNIEVLVFDDASEDGTADMVAQEFPSVRLFRMQDRKGYIVLRNLGFAEARSPYVFSIDDDAYFSHPSTVRLALDAFADDDSTGAIALQYLEPKRAPKQRYMAQTPSGARVRSFVGCAHAIRVDVAKQIGGYREFLVHQGEERDLCIRMLEKGYSVKYVQTPPIVHNPSPVRDHSRLAYLGHRNTFLFDILNVPFPSLLWRFPADVILLLKHRITLRALPGRIANTVKALVACFWFLSKRDPVSAATYTAYSRLPMHGPVAPSILQDQVPVATS